MLQNSCDNKSWCKFNSSSPHWQSLFTFCYEISVITVPLAMDMDELSDNGSFHPAEEDQLPNADAFDQYLKCREYRVTLEHKLLKDAAKKQLQKPASLLRRQQALHDKSCLPKKQQQDCPPCEMESSDDDQDPESKLQRQESPKKQKQGSYHSSQPETTNSDGDPSKSQYTGGNKDDATWPDYTLENVHVPVSNITGPGKTPHFGWAVCQNAQKGLSNGDFRRWFYCLGVYQCTECDFVARPLLPTSRDKKFGCPPRPLKHCCVVHTSNHLVWKGCTGGENGDPCKIIVTYSGGKESTNIAFTHIGKHNHPKPPVKKPSPESLRQLRKTVTENPDLLPFKLHMGYGSNKPISEWDDAFYNKSRVGYHRRRILNEKLGPQGIRGSIAALMDLAQKIPEKFFDINMGDPVSKSKPVIHMQSAYMRTVMNMAHENSSYQSDTIEGVVYDLDHLDGQISIHFTSAFDSVQQKWVPILISILFGRSTNDYHEHWKHLLGSFDASNWKEFQETFPGISVDWSEAERKGHVMAFMEHAKEKYHVQNFTEEHSYSYLRKCDVHFKRARQRVRQNASIVPSNKKSSFKNLTDILINEETTTQQFRTAVKALSTKFPKALPWLNWHLNPKRARSYFPACASEDWQARNMSKTTNAQENLGGQFQFLFGKKMTLNEAVLNLWKFVNRFELDHKAALRGLSVKYSQYPAATPKSRKRKQAKNDGRAPDTNKALKAANKGKSKDHRDKVKQIINDLFSSSSSSSSLSDSEDDARPKKQHKKTKTSSSDKESETVIGRCADGSHIFHGIPWNFIYKNNLYMNTCPLDSFLSLLFILHKGQLMVHPLAEALEEKSLLARAFKKLSENDATVGGINARMLFIEEFYNPAWLQNMNCNLFSELDIFYAQKNTGEKAKQSPILESISWEYTRPLPCCTLGNNCQHPQGPRRAVKQENIKHVTRLANTEMGHDRLALGQDGMKQIIDSKFGERVVHNNCTINYFNTGELREDGLPKQSSEVVCPGHPVQQKVSIKKFPHLAVFDHGEGAMIERNMGYTNLADVPFDFIHLGKRWLLRGGNFGRQQPLHCCGQAA